MNYEQQINAWFNGFEHRMEKNVPEVVAETAVEFFQNTFKQQAWDGVKWKALSPRYAKIKRGNGKILVRSSRLLNSIRPSLVQAGRVRISAGNAQVPYARVHNEGQRVNTIAKVKPYTNRNFMGTGRAVKIGAHTRRMQYTMPKRQFMGTSPFLNAEIRHRLINYYNS